MPETNTLVANRSKGRLLNVLTILVIVGFAGWCAVSFSRDASNMRLATLLDNWRSVLAVAALSLINYAFRSARWRIYLRRFGLPLTRRFCWLTYTAGFAFTLSPGKLGEMMRARYYQNLGIPLARVTAAFFLERLLDLLVIVALCFFALASMGNSQRTIYVVAAVLIAMMALLAVAPWGSWHERLEHAGRHSKLADASRRITHLLADAQVLLGFSVLLPTLALSLLAWSCEAVGLKIVADFASSTPLPLATCVGIYAIAIVAGAISFLPGGLGPTEAVMVTLLVNAGQSLSEATITTLVCRLLTLWFAVALGWLSVLLLRRGGVAAEKVNT